MNGPAWPDAHPWNTLVFAIAAVIFVLLNRKAMLTREGAVTEVLMPDEEGRSDGHVVGASRIPIGRAPDRMEV